MAQTENFYPTITPYLIVNKAAGLIAFLKEVFEAKERHAQSRPDGKIMHAELSIREELIMIADATENYPPMPGMIYLWLDDVDACYHKAIQAGASSLEKPADQEYGHRRCGVADAFGNQWWIASPTRTSAGHA